MAGSAAGQEVQGVGELSVVAVFGGSFDPPHVAHVLVACWARAAGGVDRVLVIPTFQHAFGKDSVSYDDRRAMAELAFGDLPFVVIDDTERDLGGESRTFHTLQALSEKYPGDSFRLVIGADILTETDRWFRWDDVAAMAPPLVVGRGGYPLPPECPLEMPEVSSTELRRDIAAGKSIAGRVPSPVVTYIETHGLYR